MISAVWIVPLVLLGIAIGLIVNCTEKHIQYCDTCPLMQEHHTTTVAKLKPPTGGSSIKLAPPLKHQWELTYADAPRQTKTHRIRHRGKN